MHTWRGAGGLTIAGDTWGDPHGPLVVLRHGGGQTRHAWKGAGETLGSAGYHAPVRLRAPASAGATAYKKLWKEVRERVERSITAGA